MSLKKFQSFFIKKNLFEKKISKVSSENFLIKYMGHACLLLECGKTTLLIDPQIGNIEGMSFYDLPNTIDYVLLTHSHQDHSALESLIQIRYKIKYIVVPNNNQGALQDPSLKLYLENCGFSNIIAMNEFEQVHFRDGLITAIPFLGEHCDLNIYSKLAFIINYQNKAILTLADSRNVDTILYKRIAAILPEIDTVFIGMDFIGGDISWLYQPLLLTTLSCRACESRRLNSCNADEAFELVKAVNCKKIYIYAIGYKPWLGNINQGVSPASVKIENEIQRFQNKCKKYKIQAEVLSEPALLKP